MIYRNADLSEPRKVDEFLIYPTSVKVPHPIKVFLYKCADSVTTTNYIAISNSYAKYEDGFTNEAVAIKPTKEACFSAFVDDFLSLFERKGLKTFLYDEGLMG